MRNLLFRIGYDGALFHGWQMQSNARSVQGEIAKAFEALTGEKPVLYGCSRTDAGVHAEEFYFNVKTESSIPAESFCIALSTKLTDEISLYSCREVRGDFNARFDCLRKEYKYIICDSPVMSPFLRNRALHKKHRLDAELMNSAAAHFVGTYDFSAFCASGSDALSKVRTIYEASVRREGDSVIFTVCGNGFLYNMVRIMAGTLVYVSEGKISAEDIPAIINGKDRTAAGVTLGPQGLYLNRVFYGCDIYEI